MAGYDVGIINIIADNLRDRYKGGFPVLKEIIQNADDASSQAGRDVQLDFGFTEGLSDADHPLLKGPALFFLNNGPFSKQDARAVKSFGLNSKAADTGSIGKFGLGMKSVFHFSVVFFWLAEDKDNEIEKAEILNPWSGSGDFPAPQCVWDTFTDADAERIRIHLQPVYNETNKDYASYFLLWLPLRQKQQLVIDGQEVGSIISEYPGDDRRQLDFLFQPGMAKKLSGLLPLLRHLTRIQFWMTKDENKLHLCYSISLNPGSKRNTYPHTKELSQISGDVKYSQKSNGVDEKVFSLKYAGYEGRAREIRLQQLRQSDRWPTSYVRDEMGRERSEPDKAKGHCAVIFSRSTEKSRGRLTIQWAVFLPLGGKTREEIPCQSDYAYTLTLHGFFFIDAGRIAIEGLGIKESDINWPPQSENELRVAWNYYLLTRGTFLLIIPSLEKFIQKSRLGVDEVTNLCSALINSSLYRAHRQHICQLAQWVFQIDKTGSRWVKIKSDQKVLPLPAPPRNEPERPWKALARLSTLEEEYIFVRQNSPHLTLKPIPQWNENSLQAVLEIDAVQVLSNLGLVNYLILFLHDDSVFPFLKISPLQNLLILFLKKGFLGLGKKISQVTAGVRELVSCVLPESRYIIKTDAKNVIRKLQKIESRFLILHKDYDARQNPGTAKLYADDAHLILENLNWQLHDYEAEGKVQQAEKCRAVIVEVLDRLNPEVRMDVLSRDKTLKIISGYNCQQQRYSSFTVKELGELRSRANVFIFSQGTNLKERLGLAPQLQEVLVNERIVVLTSKIAEIVFGEDRGNLQQCQPRGCLESLGHSCKTLGEEDVRSELIGLVSGVSLKDAGDTIIRGFRYLLHGKENLFEHEVTLWIQRYKQNKVWSKLWEQLAGNDHDNILISHHLTSRIQQESWRFLGLREIDQQDILRGIKEKGTGFIQPEHFTAEEKKEILLAAQMDRDLWKSLPLHETVHGTFVGIDEQTYLEPEFAVPANLSARLRLIKKSDDPHLKRLQSDSLYIQPLSDEIYISALLELPEPHLNISFLLDALARRPSLPPELQEKIRETPWLIDVENRPLPPSDIIFLPSLHDEVSRLLAEEPGSFFQVDELDRSIREHPYYPQLEDVFFTHDEDALEKLSLLLEQNGSYAIGTLTFDQAEFATMLDIISKGTIMQELPGWRILKAVVNSYDIEKCYQYIAEKLCRPITDNERLTNALKWLKEQHQVVQGEKREKIFLCHKKYLHVLARAEHARSILPEIQLLSQSEEWTSTKKLCVDAEGVHPSFLLNIEQSRVLRPLFPRQRPFEIPAKGRSEQYSDLPKRRDLTSELWQSVQELRDYLRMWENLVQPEILCGFVCLLGDDPDMVKIARDFQGKHTVEYIRGKIPWQVNRHQEQDGRKGWLYGLSIFEALRQFRFIVELVSGNDVSVLSLTGDEIEVFLDDHFNSLMIGKPFYEWPDGDINIVRITLRQVTDTHCSAEDFSEYLKKTAEYILKEVYGQKHVDLADIWEELNKSEQLSVRVALRLVMKHIPFYLDQLGVHKHPALSQAYTQWNDARYKVEEFHDDKGTANQYIREEEKHRRAIQHLIETDSDVQTVILDAVRKKMRDFQYTEKSVPFELFQNADDAVVEQLQIDAYPDDPDLSTQQADALFVVNKHERSIQCLHWGRPVNATGSGGFPGRERGFHQDLEKMLVLSSSNKGTENLLTGKFGLGFKSVLLVTDRPRFVSGRLGVEIVAGLYPVPLTSSQSLYQELERYPLGKRGTLIELPLKDGLAVDDVLEQFSGLAGILTVFARAIRRIELAGNNDNQVVTWNPTVICETGSAVLEKGGLVYWANHRKINQDGLYFRCRNGGGVLVGIGAKGLIPLPGDLPPVWIVAPTREKGSLGFCINGEFEIDAGRARLAGESTANHAEAKKLGRCMADLLSSLFEETEKDWPGLRDRLRLATNLASYEFWQSVWTTLTRWIERSERNIDSEVAELAANLLSGHSGLGALIQTKRILPNGLWGEKFQRLISPGDIRYVLRDSLSKESIFRPLSQWSLLRERLEPDKVITAEIFPALGKILPGFTQKKDQWQSLRLVQVLGWLKREQFRVKSEDAEVLGGVITREFLDQLQGTQEREAERNNLIPLLKKFRFQTKDDGWHESRDLLRTFSFATDDDESLRAAFAPDRHVLHSSYTGAALDFFIVCRGEMTAKAEVMAQWVLHADTEPRRQAALTYLVKGELGEQVATILRYQGTETTWLADLRADSVFFKNLTDEEIDELLYRKLPPIDFLVRQLGDDDYYEQETTVIPPVNVPATLANIHSWWRIHQEDYLEQYYRRTYPENISLKKIADDDRSAWLMVLLVGAFHTLGRAKPEQHRNFLALCQQNGWWGTFVREHPQNYPDKWMQVLEDYIDKQEDSSRFEYWMRLFPVIYKFARDLEDYVELFYELEKQGREVNVEQTLTSRTFSDLQGGGVTAAPIVRTLGMGVPFVLREMMRTGLFTKNQGNIAPYCYVPLGKVRNLFSKMECPGLETDEAHLVKSQQIHEFLCGHLGEDLATFDNAFDIPFQFVAEDIKLQEQLFAR